MRRERKGDYSLLWGNISAILIFYGWNHCTGINENTSHCKRNNSSRNVRKRTLQNMPGAAGPDKAAVTSDKRLRTATAVPQGDGMRILCRHCRAQLSRDEYFCFHDSCTLCERRRQTINNELNLPIKSPLLAFYTVLFIGRCARSTCTAWLRAVSLIWTERYVCYEQ